MCGDSTDRNDVIRLMDGNIADLLLTDPPYNVNVENSDGLKIENDNMDSESFKKFISDAMRNASDVLKPGGAFYVWYGDSEAVSFRNAMTENGLTIRECLIWVKNGFVLSRQDYHWRHEPCLYGWKEGAGHYFMDDRTQDTVFEEEKPDINQMKKEELKEYIKKLWKADVLPTTVIHEDKPVKNSEHPTMKPVRMIARQILNSSRKGEKVLDLFGGSGTTLIACEQVGRQCFMMEFDPKYCDVIVKRWEEMTGNKAELIS